MKICIEVENLHRIQETIEALERCINNKPLSLDFIHLLGAKSILEGFQHELKQA